ncbi:DUF3325 domain-containing protein [Aquabacterium olei]|uniref:DUF3325 domain-containing protein n=1 Tax=Aquabacterium olei TaxID=1296669 RepID=A0A2U8FM96_9BURK|nr:DUF3325 domain-containing protein [Aquabacterium olei]AWI52119.1 DUF3325 domain-containing protein [Aquabacterium olei]
MSDWLNTLMAPLLAHAGMVWLALAMPVHWQQVQDTRSEPEPGTQRRLRVLGAAALGGALVACLQRDHPSMAVLVWVMWLTVAAVAVTLGLAWRPRTWRLWAGWRRS